jgi:hypothetical protein
MELLLGAGSRHHKQLALPGKEAWVELITLDMNRDHNPDVCWNLERLPLPFKDDHFDEIHAYDVMEHIGKQGDWRWFFEQFTEFWRLLKPDGTFHAISPDSASRWAWGDPGHTRVLPPECLVFLSQEEYHKQIGVTPMTDYRAWYKADFQPLYSQVREGAHAFVLQAIKPARKP